LPLTHAYIGRDGLDDFVLESHWLFARSGRGFAALYNSHGLEMMQAGAMAGREVRSHAAISGWVVLVGSGDATDFQRFMDRAHATEISFDPQTLTLRVAPPGSAPLTLDYDGTFLIGQEQQIFVHEQPMPLLTYDSRTANEDAVGPFYQSGR
jgi:hypothetical protein